MQPHTLSPKHLTGVAVMACAAALIPVAALAATSSPSARPVPTATAPRPVTLGTTTLTAFKVVIIKKLHGPLNVPGPTATVYARGYKATSTGWKLIATKRLGKPGEFLWYATGICTLSVTQTKGEAPAQNYDAAAVTLLYDPAIGCVSTITKTWPTTG